MSLFDSVPPLNRAGALVCIASSPIGALAVAIVAFAGVGIAAEAQAQNVVSRPISQPLTSTDVERLNDALQRLSKRPDDMAALLEAAQASLSVNDLNAALGFFERAREIEPDDWRVSLGLAQVYLRSGRPEQALPLFDEAQEAGADPLSARSDKALALDMVGDQAGAQALYSRVIAAIPNDNEARRRLAISFAISANGFGFEATLRPLLERRDFAAFRARTFGLAIMGEKERAAAITEVVMPKPLAAKITPYLDFMPRLTPAQQAAAANLGIFPRAAQIGRDTPQIIAYRAAAGLPEPLPKSANLAVQSAPNAPSALPDQAGASASLPLAQSPPLADEPNSAVSLASLASEAAPAPLPGALDKGAGTAGEEEVQAERASGFAAAPSGEPASASPAPLQASTASQAPPIVSATPETPDHPSRIWVQLATGRNLSALGGDWKRASRKTAGLLSTYEPHTVKWGRSHRLLAGPLASRAQARELINALKKKRVDSFRYTSPEGLEIQKLK